MLTLTEAAWLSGFIDGEGYVSLTTQRMSGKAYYQAVVQVNHTHLETVEYVVSLLAKLDIEVKYVPSHRSEHQKDAWLFRVTGMENVLRLKENLAPFSITKRQQWAVVAEWCESRLGAAHKSGYSERELELAAIGTSMNKRGK